MPQPYGRGDTESREFVLELNKTKVEFDSKYIGWIYTKATVTMKNPTEKRFAWKVKTTSNDMFNIRRPVGFIDPHQTIELELQHVPGYLVSVDNMHHFSFYYVEVDAQLRDQHVVWSYKRPEGCKHLGIYFPQRMMAPKMRGEPNAPTNEAGQKLTDDDLAKPLADEQKYKEAIKKKMINEENEAMDRLQKEEKKINNEGRTTQKKWFGRKKSKLQNKAEK